MPGSPTSPDGERSRIEVAFATVACERGYSNTSAELVCEHAGLPAEAFGRHFADLEDCLCILIQEGTTELLTSAAVAFADQEGWRDQLRAVAYSMLRFLQDDEQRARLMTVEVLSAGERAQLIRDQGMEALCTFIDLGRNELDDPDSITRATAEGIGGAIFSQIRLEIEAGSPGGLPALLPKMMYSAVFPYLGPEAAKEELEMAAGGPS